MARRRPGRILAPLALIAVVVAVALVVSSTLSGEGGDGTAASPDSAPTQTVSDGKGGKKKKRPKRDSAAAQDTYTVQPGDILSTVSEQTGVSVAELQELNPDVDPQALQVGQVLKLTPDADAAGADAAGADTADTGTTTP